MIIPKVIISEMAWRQLLSHMGTTGFRYETGGVLLGYRFMQMFYIAGITFPRHYESATRTTFLLNGEEHSEDAGKIMEKYIPHLQLIGVWHSHTTEDNSFSLQDRETNKLLAGQIGKMLSVIVTQQKPNDIRLIPYYISENGNDALCKYIIRGGKV